MSKFAGNEKYEPWIYSVGALKLLSGNSVLRKTMVANGCIEALGVVLRNIIKQVRRRQKYLSNTEISPYRHPSLTQKPLSNTDTSL